MRARHPDGRRVRRRSAHRTIAARDERRAFESRGSERTSRRERDGEEWEERAAEYGPRTASGSGRGSRPPPAPVSDAAPGHTHSAASRFPWPKRRSM